MGDGDRDRFRKSTLGSRPQETGRDTTGLARLRLRRDGWCVEGFDAVVRRLAPGAPGGAGIVNDGRECRGGHGSHCESIRGVGARRMLRRTMIDGGKSSQHDRFDGADRTRARLCTNQTSPFPVTGQQSPHHPCLHLLKVNLVRRYTIIPGLLTGLPSAKRRTSLNNIKKSSLAARTLEKWRAHHSTERRC